MIRVTYDPVTGQPTGAVSGENATPPEGSVFVEIEGNLPSMWMFNYIVRDGQLVPKQP